MAKKRKTGRRPFARKPRRPNATVQPNLRIKEDLRRQLVAAAEANGVSLNAEMTQRLKDSFGSEGRELEAIVGDLDHGLKRFEELLQTMRKAMPSWLETFQSDLTCAVVNFAELIDTQRGERATMHQMLADHRDQIKRLLIFARLPVADEPHAPAPHRDEPAGEESEPELPIAQEAA